MKIIEPYLHCRFTLELPNNDKCFSFDCVSKISNLFYESNTHTWNDITITINDIIGEDITNKMLDIIKNDNIDININKLISTGDKKEIILINGKIKTLSLGEFDYASNKINEILLKIKPIKISTS